MHRSLFAAILALSLPALAGAEDYTVDFTKPDSVVGAIFHAASSGKLELLKDLCDPMKENDGDTRRVCEASMAPGDGQAEFKAYFAAGKLNGEAKVEGTAAEVPILFGPEGTKEETMVLVQRDGKWYLSSF